MFYIDVSLQFEKLVISSLFLFQASVKTISDVDVTVVFENE